MYLYLAAIWIGLAVMPAARIKAMRFVVPISAAVLLAIVLRARLTGVAFNGANIRVFMFLYGSSLFLWRDRIPMGPWLLVGILAALALASFDKTVFFVVYVVCLAPLVLHLVYVPGGRIRSFNDWGDYSYGVYIYAFPVQQTLAFLFPAMSLVAMMASSAVVSVAIAILSWKLIEERALATEGRLRRGDLARLQSRPGEDRQRRALTPQGMVRRSERFWRRQSDFKALGAKTCPVRVSRFCDFLLNNTCI